MSEWFQAKVSSLQQMSNGLIAKVVETYLIDAMSFTEAEARAIKESEGNREVTAVSIARSPIKEVVFYGDTDLWHKVKVTYMIGEDGEKEKKVTTYFLVNSADVKEAYARTGEHLKEMLVPFNIPKVELSPIVEVYQYEKQAPKGSVKVENKGVVSESEFVKKHGWGASPDDEQEEECAMESESVEAIDITKITDAQVGIFEANAQSIINRELPIGMDAAIDPTDWQAVAFQATLVAYMEIIRPYQWVKYTTEIEQIYRNNPDALDTYLFVNGFAVEEGERIADFLANDAAVEADEEANETDLEGRFDAANENDAYHIRRHDMFASLDSVGFLATESILDEIESIAETSTDFVDFANELNAYTDGKSTTTTATDIWKLLGK